MSPKLSRALGSFFGIGYFPAAPGTIASAAAACLAWYLNAQLLSMTLAFTVLGLWAAMSAEAAFGSKDPSRFVMDEVAGMMLSVLFLPVDWNLYMAGFILFRLLDVLKPWPIILLQRQSHSSSIMTDDLAAGLAVNLILQTVYRAGIFT